MYLEIQIRGHPLHRWCPADFEMEMKPPYESWAARAKAREEFARRFIEQFHLRMQPMLHCIGEFDIYLVFESKANNLIKLYSNIDEN